MNKKQIKINALDTLFFRDGRPFSRGLENWANGIFPPSPSVIYGAVRSAYLGEHIEELKNAGTENDPTRFLNINITGLYIDRDLYFPIPLDCIKEKEEEEEEESHILSLNPCKFKSNAPLDYYLSYLKKPENPVENIPDGFINLETLSAYLNLESDDFPYILLSNHIISEPKIGIGRNDHSRTVDNDGHLYRVDMMRMASKMDYGEDITEIFVEFDGIDLPESGFMKLGGEGKAVSYQGVSSLEIPVPQIEGKYFKLLIASPAVFGRGWLPENLDKSTMIWNCNGLKLKLLSTAIGKPVYIGGFDMKKTRPKPMRRAVPAGSVYYFEIIEGSMEDVLDNFHAKCISDFPDDRNQGFGLAFAGGVNEPGI